MKQRLSYWNSRLISQSAVMNLGKGVYWALLLGIFGLLQLWVNVAYLVYIQPESVSLYRLTSDGVLLFFALAITISVTMDFWFESADARRCHLWHATAFAFYPMGVTAVVIAAYLMMTSHPDQVSEDLVNALNMSVVSLTLLYIIISKTYLFQRASKTTIDKRQPT